MLVKGLDLHVFMFVQSQGVEEDRAQFLYLKGRVLNISGEYRWLP